MDSLNLQDAANDLPESPMVVIIIGNVPADSETPASEYTQFAQDNFDNYRVIFSTGTRKVNIETQA